MASADDRVVLAVITRPHGVRGEVRAKVFNPDSETLAPGVLVTVTPTSGEPRRLRVRAARPSKETWVLAFEGVASPEAAEALRGAELSVKRGELPEPEEGEYYHADLVGCEVRDGAGVRIGVVREVVTYPSVDALVVEGEGRVVEVPIVDGIVTDVQIDARVVVVDADVVAGL